MAGREVFRYSEAFKLQVVSELESGKLGSHAAACRRYGIGGGATIKSWLRRYGKNHLLHKVVRVEKPGERDQVKILQARIRDLERAVADAKVQETLHKAYFEIVCEEFGVLDPGALKKNVVERWSRERANSGSARRA